VRKQTHGVLSVTIFLRMPQGTKNPGTGCRLVNKTEQSPAAVYLPSRTSLFDLPSRIDHCFRCPQRGNQNSTLTLHKLLEYPRPLPTNHLTSHQRTSGCSPLGIFARNVLVQPPCSLVSQADRVVRNWKRARGVLESDCESQWESNKTIIDERH
jgi:hypothetical protein